MPPWRPVLLAAAAVLAAAPAASALTWQAPLSVPGPDMAPTAVPAPDGVFLVGSDGSVRDVPVGGPVPAAAESLGEPSNNGFPLVTGTSAGSARDGELVVVYTKRGARPNVYRRVRVAYRSPDGVWSGRHTISTFGRSADYARVSVAPDGSAIAAWLRHDADGRWHLQWATRPAGGDFRTATTLAGDVGAVPRTTLLGVTAAPGGGGLVTWRTRRHSPTVAGALHALPVTAGGADRPVLTLADPSAGDAYGYAHDVVRVGYAADGTATLVWVVPGAPVKGGLSGDRVVTAVLGRDGRLGERATLASLGGAAVGWGVVVGGSGAATATWAGYPSFGADTGEATATTWVASRRSGGRWTKARAISTPGVHIGFPGTFAGEGTPIVLDTAGNAVVVWGERTSYATPSQQAMSAALPSGGAWTPRAPVAIDATAPMLAGLARTGEGHVALNVALVPGGLQAPGRYVIFGDAAG